MPTNNRPANPSYSPKDAGTHGPSDPLNLSEYVAQTPRVDSMLHPSPPPMSSTVPSAQSPGAILSALSDFPLTIPGSGRTYASGFPNSFDRTQLKQPAPVFGSLPQLSNIHAFSGTTPRQRLSVSSAGESVDQEAPGGDDGFGSRATPSSGGGYAVAASADGTVEDGPLSAGIENADEDISGRKSFKDDKQEPAPPWAEMKTKAGKERKRLPLACIACRRKKIRCSGEKPACKHCLRSRIPCVYKVTTRKAAPRTDYMAMLDKRLKPMEDRVIKLIPKDSQGVVASIPRAVVKPALPTPPTKSANGKKRPAKEAFGQADADLEEWARKGQPGKSVDHPLLAKGPETEDNKLLSEGAEALPSQEIQRHLAEVYFECVYGQSYPLLHKPSFMRKLGAGKVPPVLILAVCAISARFSTHPQLRIEPAFLRGEEWASVARDISLKRYDTPNITILIVYILLGLHEFGTCQGGRSWMFGGMAQRMAFALQLHRDLDHDLWSKHEKSHLILSQTDREIRRRTMWSCFLMDRFNSSGTDRPMSMREEFIKVPLPIKESYFKMEVPGPTETIFGEVMHPADAESGQTDNAKENMGTTAFIIRLVAIWGRIVRYWNLGGQEQEEHPMWSNKSEFYHLKESLRSFHANLPASLKWNEENLQTHSSERISNQFVFMHIIYNQLILFLHRFALPFSGYGRLPADTPPHFKEDSARTALDAANQVSLLIKEAMEHSVTAPFAGYCAFYSSTVHIQGVFSKNPKLQATAKQNLAYNVKYLSKMKKYWGMFHFAAENLKDQYRQHADAARRGAGAVNSKTGRIFQYGDWFDRYPHGVSQTDFEEAAEEEKAEPGTDAVLGQKSDLQSVEDFFATLSPPSEKNRKRARTGRKSGAQRNSASSKPKARSQSDAVCGGPSASAEAVRSAEPAGYGSTPLVPDGLGAFDANGHAAFLGHNQPFLFQPGTLSQLDRQMVLSSYAGMDPHTAASITNQMPGGAPTSPTNVASTSPGKNQPIAAAGVDAAMAAGGAADMWSLDFGALPQTAFAGYNTDLSTHWFMPFNLEPPADMQDDGLIGTQIPYGLGLDGYGIDGLGSTLDSKELSGE